RPATTSIMKATEVTRLIIEWVRKMASSRSATPRSTSALPSVDACASWPRRQTSVRGQGSLPVPMYSAVTKSVMLESRSDDRQPRAAVPIDFMLALSPFQTNVGVHWGLATLTLLPTRVLTQIGETHGRQTETRGGWCRSRGRALV